MLKDFFGGGALLNDACVADAHEFRFPQLSKVLTTSATKLATKFDEKPRRKGDMIATTFFNRRI